mmetsp:Transcript_21537/g.47255  ORF Transcript_21537/g.47255 Transcript_21537/m.47255 type:complete len:234 (+) Transcript_21537:169-870(+)
MMPSSSCIGKKPASCINVCSSSPCMSWRLGLYGGAKCSPSRKCDHTNTPPGLSTVSRISGNNSRQRNLDPCTRSARRSPNPFFRRFVSIQVICTPSLSASSAARCSALVWLSIATISQEGPSARARNTASLPLPHPTSMATFRWDLSEAGLSTWRAGRSLGNTSSRNSLGFHTRALEGPDTTCWFLQVASAVLSSISWSTCHPPSRRSFWASCSSCGLPKSLSGSSKYLGGSS